MNVSDVNGGHVIDYGEARGRMVAALSRFAEKPKPAGEALRKHFDELIDELVIHGWRRRDLFALARDLLTDESLSLPEESTDRLLDFEGQLIGHCAKRYVPKFPGEPDSDDEFFAYVYSKRWMTD